jgi:hypothetical protein
MVHTIITVPWRVKTKTCFSSVMDSVGIRIQTKLTTTVNIKCTILRGVLNLKFPGTIFLNSYH